MSRGLSTERAGAGSPPQPLSLVGLLHGLAVEREIEAFALDLLGHPQPDEDVDDLEDDQRHDDVGRRTP